jgi:hypothetical protein
MLRWAIALVMEAESTSETSVKFYQTTRCNNPENSHFQYCDGLLSAKRQLKASSFSQERKGSGTA